MKKKIWGFVNVDFLCILVAWINFVMMMYKHHVDDLNGIVCYGFMAVFMLLLSIRTKPTKK